ncbi:OOP family OmpA-OmpF porin [Massilia sp. UYP32]|jgi:OmpA-OmpF porin, OOP family|uniref:Outer membrane protein beta-barrel domain-containing protein n=1 Tax=Massilia timonae CCUG 45783 TaxID=883126 RepID=K9DFJ3_9BURK|nr:MULTISPECIES: porin family protein [Massilia]EKU82978.1 hypothetical protein HMPREF9710_01707 [Massilia timonae CCUG 45783]QYF99537.1 porin family protein [Massilia sp. NP310]
MKKILITLAATVAAIGSAQAQTVVADGGASRPYIGAAVSGAKNQTTDDWQAGGKIFGGYNIDQNWAVEVGHSRFGNEDFNVAWAPGFADARVKSSRTYAAAKYTMPVNAELSAYGKLGASYNETKTSFMGDSYTDRDTGAYAALGVQYALAPNVALFGEYERYGKKKEMGAKADVVSVGLQYGF